MAGDKTQDKYNKRHRRNLNSYGKRIDNIYRDAIRDAVAIGGIVGELKPDKMFSFDDYPITRKRVDKLLKGLEKSIETAIINGVEAEWTLANNKNSELSNRVFGKNVGKLTKEQYKRYFSNNDDAREAFIQRKENGLNLSDRVWSYTDQFKEEIEMGLDLGIRSGRSADEMSRDIRSYLKHPDKLFRRVRDEYGQLQLSKRAGAYHPGRGVYRSSYKNARRLAATETNMAYRTADYMRWQSLDFVVGIQIEPSKTNHTPDICDDLAGRYPKDFKWTGWHPHCRCHALTILKTEKEMEADTERILNGEEPLRGSVNQITALPKRFTEWASDNEERINGAKSAPYFLKDNATTVFCREDMKQFRPMVYNILSQDKNYKDVAYDKLSGGLKATHIEHNFDHIKGYYEETVQDVGYRNGHAVILDAEPQNIYKKKSCEGVWDGLPVEVAGAENATASNIRNALKHCASKPDAQIAVLFFPNGKFSSENFNTGYAMFSGLQGTSQYKKFNLVYCIQGDKIVQTKKPDF